MKKLLVLKILAMSVCFDTTWAMDLSWPSSCQLTKECLAFQSNKNIDISPIKKSLETQSFDVLAASAGKVQRVRDGQSDLDDSSSTPEKSCGNGVIIEHEDGWETQYCFLKKNSIVVYPGEQVATGKVLGKMGTRMLLSVRHHNELVDPYEANLWRDPTLSINEVGVMDVGMSNKKVDVVSLVQNPPRDVYFTRQDPSMLAWVRVLNIKQGDQQKFIFYSPDGNVYRHPIEATITADHSEWISVAGYPLQNKNIPIAYNGEWRMTYLIKRGNKPWRELAELRFKLEQ